MHADDSAGFGEQVVERHAGRQCRLEVAIGVGLAGDAGRVAVRHHPAAEAQHRQAALKPVLADAVHHDVDAVTAALLDLGHPVGVSKRVLDALRAQHLVLARRRGRVQLHSVPAGELHRGETDAAGGRVDQYPLTRARPGGVLDGRVRGEVVERKSGARRGRHAGGKREAQDRRGADQLGVRGGGAVRGRGDPVADGWRSDVRTDGRHRAGDLDAGPVGRLALDAQPGPHIGEVDTHRLRGNQHLARPGLRDRRVHDAQHLRAAGPLRHHLSHRWPPQLELDV